MLFLQERKGQGDQLLLLSEVFRLLYLLDTEAREEKSSGRPEENVRDLERIKQTMEYIQDHYQEPLTLSDGAAFLSVTPEHFCRLFKKYTGQTFLGYLGQVRMTHFYEDLSGEDKITLLMDRHGIRNYKVFLREFKKNYGQTPQQVRRKIS
jgi:YesN/AraC family two-component response regulator